MIKKFLLTTVLAVFLSVRPAFSIEPITTTAGMIALGVSAVAAGGIIYGKSKGDSASSNATGGIVGGWGSAAIAAGILLIALDKEGKSLKQNSQSIHNLSRAIGKEIEADNKSVAQASTQQASSQSQNF